MKRVVALLVVACAGSACAPVLDDAGADEEQPAPESTPPPIVARRPDAALPVDSARAPDAAAERDGATPRPDASTPGAAADAAPPRMGNGVLPVLWIEVGRTIVQDTKVPAKLRLIEDHDRSFQLDAAFKLTNADALTSRPVTLASDIGIEIRGNSTAGAPKPSYGVELRDGAGADVARPLLGMPPESDWVLHSCTLDRTCLRNALAYAIGRELGRYNPRTRFAEVFIDGGYRGLYLVTEKIKADKARVPISRPSDGVDATGGYIVRREGVGKGVARDFRSPAGTVYTYHFPRHDEITPAQKSYLQDFMNRLEAAFRAPDWADPARGYGALADVPSWIDYALVQEATKNVDAYFKSVYMYKLPDRAGGKLFMSPLWDFDAAFGNAGHRDAARPDGWQYKMNRFGTEGGQLFVPTYWERLWTDAAFLNESKCRWLALRRGPLLMANIDAAIARWVQEIAAAVITDRMRWKVTGSHADDVKKVRDWLDQRLRWIDANHAGQCAAAPSL